MVDYIDRANDETIIDLVREIMGNGTLIIETINEAVLVKMLELRGTPIPYENTYRNIDEDYERWKNSTRWTQEEIDEINKTAAKLHKSLPLPDVQLLGNTDELKSGITDMSSEIPSSSSPNIEKEN